MANTTTTMRQKTTASVILRLCGFAQKISLDTGEVIDGCCHIRHGSRISILFLPLFALCRDSFERTPQQQHLQCLGHPYQPTPSIPHMGPRKSELWSFLGGGEHNTIGLARNISSNKGRRVITFTLNSMPLYLGGAIGGDSFPALSRSESHSRGCQMGLQTVSHGQ